MWLLFWIGFLLFGIAILLPLYAGLLVDLKKHNEKEFLALGSPQLLMLSPARGLRLQKFMYSGSRKENIHPLVRKKCLLLGTIQPIFILLIFVTLFFAVRMDTLAISPSGYLS